jgi:cytohesin
MELLLKKGAPVNAKDMNGRTPLHEAASMGANGAIRLLVSHGASVNARDNAENTALHEAAYRG